MSDFTRALKELLRIEGDFSDHPADSGGATRWGVTEYLARAYGYVGDMREYSIEDAMRVYRMEFWDRMLLDQIAGLSYAIAYELFDTEVNTPYGTAPTMLQRMLNVLNMGGTLYSDVAVDGRIGPQTISALRVFLHRRGVMGELVMMRGLNALQGAYYVALAERRQKDEAFVLGWFNQRVSI